MALVLDPLGRSCSGECSRTGVFDPVLVCLVPLLVCLVPLLVCFVCCGVMETKGIADDDRIESSSCGGEGSYYADG